MLGNPGWKGPQDVIQSSLFLKAEPAVGSEQVTQRCIQSGLENMAVAEQENVRCFINFTLPQMCIL